MRVVVQRVTQASVTVNNTVLSSIQSGYVLLVGLKQGDTVEDVKYVANKVAKLRIFSDQEGKLNLSIREVNGQILSISQFTLYGDVSKSNRPGFSTAMNYTEADLLYQTFNRILEEEYGIIVHHGAFGEHMEIALVNDGPVTILIEK